LYSKISSWQSGFLHIFIGLFIIIHINVENILIFSYFCVLIIKKITFIG
jgi:hypothetical protein